MPTTKTLDGWWNDAGNSRDTDILLVLEEEYNKLKSASDDTLATLKLKNLELKEENNHLSIINKNLLGINSSLSNQINGLIRDTQKQLIQINELKEKIDVLSRDMKGSLSFIEEHQELKRQYKELKKENEKLKKELDLKDNSFIIALRGVLRLRNNTEEKIRKEIIELISIIKSYMENRSK